MKSLVYFTERDAAGWENGFGGTGIQFKFVIGKKERMIQGDLKMDYYEVGDGKFWMMQPATVVKAVYTQKDMLEKKLRDNAPVLEDGEIVAIRVFDHKTMQLVSDKQYKFIVKGNYSDAAIFEEIK